MNDNMNNNLTCCFCKSKRKNNNNICYFCEHNYCVNCVELTKINKYLNLSYKYNFDIDNNIDNNQYYKKNKKCLNFCSIL